MQTFTEIVISNALLATLLALVAACVCRFVRQPFIAYGLWLLVLIKLVTPSFVKVSLP